MSEEETEEHESPLERYFIEKSGFSELTHKRKIVEQWMNKVPLYKRRKVREVANRVYDEISSWPEHSKILDSDMSFRDKCALIEQIEILSHTQEGTDEFFARKRDILRRIQNYDAARHLHKEMDAIDKECDALVSATTTPLKMRIARSNLSSKNKAVLLEKFKTLSTMASNDDTHPKLLEYIEWGLKISDMITPLPVDISDGSEKINQYLYEVKSYLDAHLYGMTSAKERLLELLALKIRNPSAKNMSLALCGPPGVGKCLHPDTQVLMFFGGMKAAKNIARGDILMGDDNTPRIVMSATSGIDDMYKIIPEVGDSFITNSCHVLTLHNPQSGQTVDIPLNEYVSKSDVWKTKHLLFSKPVEYQKQVIKNDPYLVGLLLGAETKSMDEIVKEFLSKKLDDISSSVRGKKPSKIEVIDRTEIEYLINHRYIPDEYLYNTREIRFKLLRGYYEAVAFEKSHPVSKNSSKASSRTSSPARFDKRRAFSAERPGSRPSSRPVTPTTGDKRRAVSANSRPGSRPNSRPTTPTTPTTPTSRNVARSTPRPSSRPGSRPSSRPGSRSATPTRTPAKTSRTPAISKLKYGEQSRKSRLDDFKSKLNSKTLKVKDRILCEQLKFLCRSIGYECYQVMDNLIIQSDLKEIPDLDTKITTKFEVISHDRGEYSGFTLDKNGRFLLASCMVTHNTELIQTFGEATSQPFAKINMGGSVDPAYYLGHSYTYIGSAPGVLVRTIAELKNKENVRTKSGILFFDEFDKIGMSSAVGHAFLHISDPIQQKSFQDHYLSDMTIDVSNITFVYSMNDLKNIDTVLQNRLPIIHLAGYTSLEKIQIAMNHLIPKQMKNANLTSEDVEFTKDAIKHIVARNTSDKDGMRRISQSIQTLIGKLGALLCSAGSSKIFSYSIDTTRPIKVTPEVIDKLGIFKEEQSSTLLSMYL